MLLLLINTEKTQYNSVGVGLKIHIELVTIHTGEVQFNDAERSLVNQHDHACSPAGGWATKKITHMLLMFGFLYIAALAAARVTAVFHTEYLYAANKCNFS